MDNSVASEFARFVKDERRAKKLPESRAQLAEGELAHPVFVDPARASEFVRVAAKRAAGFIQPTKRAEIVWVRGESELALKLVDLDVRLADGFIRILIPVRCDQTGAATIEIAFAVGSKDKPAGLYASTYRRPNGPPLIVAVWGEALVAFAWQCVLGMISGIAGATGKDARGNLLVPVEMSASTKGIRIVPMARHRFAGSTGLRNTMKTRGTR